MTRGARLAELVAEHELDQLFVSDLTNVRYLTGFTGTNGACLVGRSELVFFTDFRYTERAKEEVASEWERPEAERELIPQIVARMSGRVGFEDAKLSVRQLARLEAAAGEDVEFLPAGDLVEQLRVVKEPEEIERMAAAAELADDVYEWALERGLAGRTERDVARACEARIRELGAEPSFPPIVAAGPNGALPHAEPGEREIGTGELVVFDMGAAARRLLLGLHPHLRHRGARGRGPRGLRARPARPRSPRWRRCWAGGRGQGGRRGGPRDDL